MPRPSGASTAVTPAAPTSPLRRRSRQRGQADDPARRAQFRGRVDEPPEPGARDLRAGGAGAHAVDREELLEWDYGDYEGLTTPEIRAQRPGWSLWRDGCPGASAADVGRRVDRLVNELAAVEGDSVCFAHGHVLRVLAARWIGLDPSAGALLALSTGSISELGRERETRVLWGWNETEA